MTAPTEGPTDAAVRAFLARYGPITEAEMDAILEGVIADGLVTREGQGDHARYRLTDAGRAEAHHIIASIARIARGPGDTL